MERLRKGPVVRRVTLSVVALYALMLQAFVVAAAPVAVAPGSAIACAQDDSGSQPRGGEKHHNHQGLCCILACAACGSAYVPVPAAAAFIPAREIAAARWTLTPPTGASGAPRFSYSARGPPQAL